MIMVYRGVQSERHRDTKLSIKSWEVQGRIFATPINRTWPHWVIVGRARCHFEFAVLHAKDCYRIAFATASIAGSRAARYASMVHGAAMSGSSDATAMGRETTARWQSSNLAHPPR